jgi:16S rRNA (uracil1498-N3)-methyltransferase
MIRLRVAELPSATHLVTGDDHHYLARVRRSHAGDPVTLFDGAGRSVEASVARVEPEHTELRIVGDVVEAAPVQRVTVLQALIKGERMDWCIEKLVEVGATDIVIFESERTVVRLAADRAAARQRRLAALADAAARQCGRAEVPRVLGPLTYQKALDCAAEAANRLICLPYADEPLLDGQAADGSAALIIGPEGGLSPSEIAIAVAAGYRPVSLGRHVLRAETAGMVAVAGLRLLADLDTSKRSRQVLT